MEKLEYENMKLRIENERLKKGYMMKGDGSYGNVQKIKDFEFEIILTLSKDFNVKSLCEYMNVSRSGYYKWLKNKEVLNRYEIDRLELEKLIKEIHNKKPSYGYRRINRIILKTTGMESIR